MTSILLAIVLTGPVPDRAPRLALTIHLGKDFQSRVIRSELGRTHPWFASRRAAIEEHYRLVIDGDEFDAPTWSIGRGAERQAFPAGAFRASGTFLLCLESLAAIDRWDRNNPFLVPSGIWATEAEFPEYLREQAEKHFANRPRAYPLREDQ